MKLKTTAKAIRNGFNNVKCAGYCDLQDLFRFVSPTAYTCGVYGWNFDAFIFDGLVITTGYRGMVGARAEGIREYNEKARAIYDDRTLDYDDREARIMALLDEFVKLNGGWGR